MAVAMNQYHRTFKGRKYYTREYKAVCELIKMFHPVNSLVVSRNIWLILVSKI